MADMLGACRWCHRPIAWDHDVGMWRHTESGSLLCPSGSWAAIDLDSVDVNGNLAVNDATRPTGGTR